ncbi:MAG: ABC transporter substrate-binding protein [Chloroflexi bacterium]|nr:ABC transporter substrate-binding protein [Chloroflexota bacterium]
MSAHVDDTRLTRRVALRLLAVGGVAAVLAACGGTTAPANSGVTGASSPNAATGSEAVGTAGAKPAGIAAAAGASGAPAASPAASGPVKTGGVLKILAGGPRITNAMGYDPAAGSGGRAVSMMFEGLTRINDDYSISPALAQSWDVSQDGKTYTFKLRSGVKFHNGRPMTSDDVKYSLERVLDPKTLSPYAKLLSVVDSISTPDPSTVAVNLKQPYGPFLALLADDPEAIVPKEEVAKGSFANNPVGTGPFKFVSADADKGNMVLAKNSDYWEQGFPRVERIEGTDVLDLQADFLRFQAGQFDMFLEAPEDQFTMIKAKYPVAVAKDTNWVYFRLNPIKIPQFKDPKMVEALNWVIDRAQLASFALPPELGYQNGGSGTMVAWAAPKEPFLFPKQDLAKAKQLLSDAGISSGFKFEIQTMRSVAYLPNSIQVVQQMLNQVGINPSLTVLERAPTASQQPMIDSYLGGSPGAYDPDFELTQWFTKGGSSNPYNFQDDQVDQLLQQARSSLDQTKRGDLYRQVQTRTAQVSNVLYLYNDFKYHVSQAYVKGMRYSGPAEHRWFEAREVWLDK